MRLEVYESDVRYNRKKKEKERRPALKEIRMLSRYREYVNRRKRILADIERKNKELAKMEKEPEKPVLVDLYIDLGRTSLRIRECEEILQKVDDEIVRDAVVYRFFEDTERKMPSWSETTKAVGISLNGRELQRYVNAYFNEKQNQW